MPTKVQAITFEVEDQLYGIETCLLQEIIPILKIKPIAKGPAFMVGVINLRGKVIPIVDLRKLLGAQSGRYTFDTRIVVGCIGPRTVGFIVDGIREVREFMKDQISSPVIDAPGTQLIENVVTLDSGEMIQLIALNHVMDKEELEQLALAQGDTQS